MFAPSNLRDAKNCGRAVVVLLPQVQLPRDNGIGETAPAAAVGAASI